jgi:hypothetical protein
MNILLPWTWWQSKEQPMKRVLVAALFALVAAPVPAFAEHANINLRVFRLDPVTGQSMEEAAATADQEPPAGGVQPRPLFKVKANEPLVMQFILVNTYPHGTNKDVAVRYFVVPEKSPRQKELPDPADGAVTQGKFILNFQPKCRVGARVAFTVREPGVYLLRVDTLNTGSDHEHFSAIDLRVE